jgi:N-formylglutamate amidohydrolase
VTVGAASFTRHGPADPRSPVVLSVPHAGRDYPLELRAALKLPVAALRPLEDRYADLLALAAHRGETLLVAQRARAWIDLNRAESERDSRIDDGAPAGRSHESAKLRGGLGLVPRRVGVADIWNRRLSDEEVVHRIATDHRPYHDALAATLAATRARFGIAVLLDIHSMPSLGTVPGTPRIVFGDRFGKSASARLVGRLEGVAQGAGIAFAANTPYSGGHILDRHADPANHLHAIQIEFDRGLYLDGKRDGPGPDLERTAAVLRAMIDAVADEALPRAIAAE